MVGDGAVGLSAVLAAKRIGAERIIALSRHEVRQELARAFGATDIVAARGEEAIETVKKMTDGIPRPGREPVMAGWSDDELRRIGGAEELEIAPVRRNGELRARTIIWVVRAGDDLYVRAAYGSGSGWHRVARTSRRGRIWAGGVERDVTIEDADGSVLDQVDAAYREKYGRRYASIVDTIIDEDHRATTLRPLPHR